MAWELRRDDGLLLSDDHALLDVGRIYAWLSTSYWANERDRATVERSLRHSTAYGVYAPGGEQVALTRATTDFTSFCWLGDVFVDPAWQRQGIGTWMVGAVVDRMRGLGVPRIVLATRDAHGVYAKLGFEPLRVPQTWMEIDSRPNRPSPGDVRAP